MERNKTEKKQQMQQKAEQQQQQQLQQYSEDDNVSLSSITQPPNISEIDSEAPLSQYPGYASQFTAAGEDFISSSAAQEHLVNCEFTDLIGRFNDLVEEEEERTDEQAPDLEPEDDAGNTEYKFKMCDLTMYKVRKRTTQMAYRLTEGKGEAFYEVGVHDNGELIGIEYEEIIYTMLALFHMSQILQAKLEVILVRLGAEGYNVQLRVTKPQPEAIEPEVDAFMRGLNLLRNSRVYESVRTLKSSSAAASNADHESTTSNKGQQEEEEEESKVPATIRLKPLIDSNEDDEVCKETESSDFEKIKRQRSQTDEGFPTSGTTNDTQLITSQSINGAEKSGVESRSRILSEEVINNPETSSVPIIQKE